MAEIYALHQEQEEQLRFEKGEQTSREAERIAEAMIFASSEPVPEKQIARKLPAGANVESVMRRLAEHYAGRGVNLLHVGDCWAFRTAPDVAFSITDEKVEPRRLSRAALEVLAIVAYHQPATRAEIEEIRGVSTSKGTLDLLLEAGWVRLRGRRRTPGRPVTYGTTTEFLDHFGLEEIGDLPGIDELKGAGLLSVGVPGDFGMAGTVEDEPDNDEAPLSPADLEELGLLPPDGADE